MRISAEVMGIKLELEKLNFATTYVSTLEEL